MNHARLNTVPSLGTLLTSEIKQLRHQQSTRQRQQVLGGEVPQLAEARVHQNMRRQADNRQGEAHERDVLLDAVVLEADVSARVGGADQQALGVLLELARLQDAVIDEHVHGAVLAPLELRRLQVDLDAGRQQRVGGVQSVRRRHTRVSREEEVGAAVHREAALKQTVPHLAGAVTRTDGWGGKGRGFNPEDRHSFCVGQLTYR